MAQIVQDSRVTMELTFTVTEMEARALDALVGYSDDAFLKVFYEHLGTHYMKPYEAGLRSLFKSIRESVPEYLTRANKARLAFKGE
jgi:hypothetical protein